jgi:transcriptional regulator with XRE-family HTH domain
MTSRDEERARVLAAYTDDLLADREPTVSAEAATLFTPEELVQALSTARFLKGLLRPSRLDPAVETRLRARLVQRVRDARAAAIAGAEPVMALPALLAARRRAAGLSIAALAARTGLRESEIADLEADSVPLNIIPPQRLVDVATALAIPARELLQAAQLAAEHWVPRLTRRGLQPGLAAFQAATGIGAAADREAARREAAEALAEYLAQLERLAREQGLA